MKYCRHCGKELDENAEVCMACGCQAEAAKKETKTRGKGLTPKSIVLIVASVLAIVGLIIGAKVLKDQQKKKQVIQQLVGETFTYEEYGYYSGYNVDRLTFIDGDTLEYYYVYSSVMDAPTTYEISYKVEVKGDSVYIVGGIKRYKVVFDADGNVEALYDEILDKKFEN